MNGKEKCGLAVAFWVFVAVLFALAPVPRAEAASPFGTGTDGDLVVNSGETVFLDQWYNTRHGANSYLSTPDAVPNFRNVTINSGGTLTVSGYNSSTGKGGKLEFKATGNVMVSGSITVKGLGYTGGKAGYKDPNSGQRVYATAGQGPGGGAGGDNRNPPCGCPGGSSCGQGASYADNPSRLGSGGGGGSWNGYTNETGGDGGNGGGSISITAGSIVISGLVSSEGNDGRRGRMDGTYHYAYGGGGGSGGAIRLVARNIDVGSSKVTALGGINVAYGYVSEMYTKHGHASNGPIEIVCDTFSGTTATPSTVAHVDLTPPTGTFSINGGSEFTTTALVNLALTAQDNRSGVAQVAVSNDNFQTQQVFSYQPQIAWTLTPDKGPKRVWVKFIDAAGNESDPLSQTVNLVTDTTPPAVNLLINEGTQVTDSPNVRLLVNAVDDYSSGSDLQVRLSNDGRS